jgi:4-hydroxyphenylpyruvate dioxygenase
MLINRIDHVELIVGNALQAAQFYRLVLGFNICAYAGSETGNTATTSYLLQLNDIRILLTSPRMADGDINAHLSKHGEGVRDIAFSVDDAAMAFREAVDRGAVPVQEPIATADGEGQIIVAKIATFGDTLHSFVQRSKTTSFLPNYKAAAFAPQFSARLRAIDHFAVAVEEGRTSYWAQFYRDTFGFNLAQEEYTSSEYSAMNTKVVQNPSRSAILVLVEPAPGLRKSPISEFLVSYQGPGVHHIATATDDIVMTVRTLRDNGVSFAKTPSTYYEDLSERVGTIAADLDHLRELNILVDRDESGYLMQIFCNYLQTRPTLFFEIIQRMGAHGFGSGNIKALFKALERQLALVAAQ